MSNTANHTIHDRPGLIDTHAHLNDHRLASAIDGVLERARAAGLVQIVAVGTTVEDSDQLLELVCQRPGLFAAVGIHPNDAAEAGPDDWNRIVALAAREKVVALGETGLDRYWDRTPFPVQQDYFDRHLALGRERGLPVVIHCRDCQADILDQLRRQGSLTRGVWHSFTGTWDDAQAALELGLYIGFAGMITFTNKALDPLREVAARVPADRLLVETDSPYLSPHPERGKPNEPGRIVHTATRLAELREISLGVLASTTTANARRLFGLTGECL
jgi:TatD DNase family protein